MGAFCTAWLIGVSVCAGMPTTDTPIFTVDNVNPIWLRVTQRQVTEQLDMLTSAYGLDAETRQSLIEELQRRMEAEVGFQRASHAELSRLNELAQSPDAGPEAMEKVTAKLREVVENAPLNEERVVTWLEKRVSPKVLPESRRRLSELRFRRTRKRDVTQEDALERSKTRKMLAREARQCKARLTEQGNPMPSRIETRKTAGQPEQGWIVCPGRGATSRKTPPIDVSTRSSLKCPPLSLDDWDRFLRGALAGANADAAQAQACRALLARFKEKVSQYVQDHAEVFGTLALAPTPEAYEARLAELRQGTPIDAYFAELKLRVADVLNR